MKLTHSCGYPLSGQALWAGVHAMQTVCVTAVVGNCLVCDERAGDKIAPFIGKGPEHNLTAWRLPPAFQQTVHTQSHPRTHLLPCGVRASVSVPAVLCATCAKAAPLVVKHDPVSDAAHPQPCSPPPRAAPAGVSVPHHLCSCSQRRWQQPRPQP